MNLPFGMALFGLVVSAIFLFNSLREMRRNVEGHARNAAMIHLAMVSMFIPFCLFVVIAYAP